MPIFAKINLFNTLNIMFKKFFTALTAASLLILSGVSANAKVITNPSFEARTSSILTVEEIDLGKKATRLKFRAVFRPGWWISVDSTEYILNPATGEKFYPVAAEGMKFGEHITMPESGDTVFTIIFPPLPKNTRTIDLFPESSWKTFGLSLSDKKGARKAVEVVTPVEGQRIPNPSFFTPGNVRIHGQLKGYDPRFTFDAIKIYTEDLPIGKSGSRMIPLDSCGRFDYELPLASAASTFMTVDGKANLPIYIEPNNDLQIILDMEDILDVDRKRGLRWNLEDVEFGGSLAEINRAILKAPEYTGPHAYTLANNTAPLEAKELISRSIADYKEQLEKYVAANSFTPFTNNYLMSCVLSEEAVRMFDYDFYRRMNHESYPDSAIFADPMPLEFFAEIGPATLNADTTLLAAPSTSMLLNRIAYSTLPNALGIEGRYISDKATTAEAIARFCNREDVPFIWQITISGMKGSSMRRSSADMADFYRSELDKIYGKVITSPYLRGRLDNLLSSKTEAVAEPLPDTPGGQLMAKLAAPYAGKWLLVDFWATSCGPCRSNIEHQEEFRNANRDNDSFTFLFITSEDQSPRRAYEAYVEKHLKDDNSLYLTQSEMLKLQDLFEINAIPHYVLINPEGLLYDKDFNSDFRNFLRKQHIEYISPEATNDIDNLVID